ncbi:MAG: hypothetical protein ACKVT0_09275 [Planctomycetaceae bacterium]
MNPIRRRAVAIGMGLLIALTLSVSATAMVRYAPRRYQRPHRLKPSDRANDITSRAYRFRRPAYQESPRHRETRTVNSPSLYAGPYPFGGLYTWRQYYYGHERNPLLDRLHATNAMSYYFIDPSYTRYIPFHATDTIRYPASLNREWGMSVKDVGAMVLQSSIVAEDPVNKLQEQFFSDDRSAEDVEQLKFGY